jgi:hypothetical protein
MKTVSAPSACASMTAADPTPPAAWISAHPPEASFSEMDQCFVRRDKDLGDCGGGKGEPVGNRDAIRESTRAYSVYAPPPMMAITRSPFRKSVGLES